MDVAPFLQALPHDPDRLLHLFHAEEIAAVAVAVLADRYVKIEFGVAFGAKRLVDADDIRARLLCDRNDADGDAALRRGTVSDLRRARAQGSRTS